MTGDMQDAKILLDEAFRMLPAEPLIVTVHGVFYALTGREGTAPECWTMAGPSLKSFVHAHHSYGQLRRPLCNHLSWQNSCAKENQFILLHVFCTPRLA